MKYIFILMKLDFVIEWIWNSVRTVEPPDVSIVIG